MGFINLFFRVLKLSNYSTTEGSEMNFVSEYVDKGMYEDLFVTMLWWKLNQKEQNQRIADSELFDFRLINPTFRVSFVLFVLYLMTLSTT
jgi:hypothetical protein